MRGSDSTSKWLLLVIALLLAIIAVRLLWSPNVSVSAQSGFEHVYLLSSGFLYQGNTGVLLMDKRNANVWFLPRNTQGTAAFKDPIFILRLPLEKLDQPPR